MFLEVQSFNFPFFLLLEVFCYIYAQSNFNAIIICILITTTNPREAPLNVHKLGEDSRRSCDPCNPLAVTFDPNEVKVHTDKRVNGKQGNFV